MAHQAGDQEHPIYTPVSGTHTGEPTTHLVVSRGRTRIDITVDHELLRGTKFFAEYERQLLECNEQVRQYLAGVPKTRPYVEPHDFIYEYLLPFFLRLAPDPDPKLRGLTVQDLLDTPTYSLRIVPGLPGSGNDVSVEGEEDGVTYTPDLCITPRSLEELPESCMGIKRVDAAELCIDPMLEEMADHYRVWFAQGSVRLKDGQILEFRPHTKRRSMKGQREELDSMRELQILGKIKELRLTAGEVRLPNLVGIVVSGDSLVGMLIEPIARSEKEGSIIMKRYWEDADLCNKWEKQVIKTVGALHENDIIWGTPWPLSILIDEALNAWVTDFGGLIPGCQFVDKELRETYSGDWQGVKRVFKDWLPSRCIDIHSECSAF